MSEKNDSDSKPVETQAHTEQAPPPKYDWSDPSVPAGDAPSMPRGPMIASIVVYCGWLIFLISMVVLRLKTTS